MGIRELYVTNRPLTRLRSVLRVQKRTKILSKALYRLVPAIQQCRHTVRHSVRGLNWNEAAPIRKQTTTVSSWMQCSSEMRVWL
jgi:hypothetical protein